jgi:phage gp29-like protein
MASLKQIIKSVNPFGRSLNATTDVKKNLANYIAPIAFKRLRHDVSTWRDILVETENVFFPHRVKAQRLYIDTINNGHVFACMERRKDLTLLRKWEFINSVTGEINENVQNIFTENIQGKSQNKEWFNNFLNYSLDSIFFGYSLIALGDIIADEFPNLQLIKRWNVSPDRQTVSNITYSISGEAFLEEPYKNWHVYVKTYNDIGTSKSGYGLLYKVGLYEIFLRNLLGFNGDFIELYAQPYRVGKTTKTNEDERSELANTLKEMGSAGWALIDPEDDIKFLETALGGTGYKGYEDLEKRLEAKISKIILGHSDALDSTPGKLGGGQGDANPVQIALNDKQTKDGSFISNVVNSSLIENMRNLGFNIPIEVKAVMKNDTEIMETNNSIIDQAVKIKSAGLQMDAAYFTEQTGIPVAEQLPSTPFQASIKNKLDKLYNKHNH